MLNQICGLLDWEFEAKMNWYLKVWKGFANFDGRSRRKEFWIFSLVNVLIFLLSIAFALLLILSGIDSTSSIRIAFGIFTIYLAFSLIPCLAVCVRRYHDLGKSGLWLLIWLFPVIGGPLLLIDMAKDGG